MSVAPRKTLVTGSSGHLGEALVRTLRDQGSDVIGLDIKDSPFTTVVGSITDRECVRACMDGVRTVYHAATLHKPHVVTHEMEQFVETNVRGTLVLLEAAAQAGVESLVYTSTTSAFGDALRPPSGAPAAWVTENLQAVPKNIYGVTKTAAEDLCRLFARKRGLACIVLRTSRFFPEADDDKTVRSAFEDANVKVNEFLFRRIDVEDVVSAHLAASERAPSIRFGNYIVSATTPFLPGDLRLLRTDAATVVRRRAPEYEEAYLRLGWRMFEGIDRVYVNQRARTDLDWTPKYDFGYWLSRLEPGVDPRSDLAKSVGSKGYHSTTFAEGPYPVD